jgi:hypothetical protein
MPLKKEQFPQLHMIPMLQNAVDELNELSFVKLIRKQDIRRVYGVVVYCHVPLRATI